MSDFRRYQPRRSTPSIPWRRWFVVVAAVIVVVLVWRAFAGHGKSPSNSNTVSNSSQSISLLNDNTSTANTNAAANTNSATNTNASVEPGQSADSWTNFSVSSCSTTIGTGTTTAKKVALTFDLAAANQQAQDLLKVLTDKKVPATFFSTGAFAAGNADFVGSLASAGYGVYSRGQKSVDLTTLSAADLKTSLTTAEQNISSATGITPKPLLRPPYGSSNAALVTAAKASGYCVVTWSVDAFDWQDTAAVDTSEQRVLAKLQPGAIIDLHAGYDITAALVTKLLQDFSSQGYTPVSLATLLNPS